MSSDRIPLTRRYLKSVLHHWQAFTAMLICMVCVGLIQPLLPWMLAPLLDAGNSDKEYLLPVAALPYAMLLIILLLGAFSYGRSYLGGWLDATLQRDYRRYMTQHLLRLPLGDIQRQTTGKLTSRFILYLPQLTSATLPICMALVQETIKAAGYISPNALLAMAADPDCPVSRPHRRRLHPRPQPADEKNRHPAAGRNRARAKPPERNH